MLSRPKEMVFVALGFDYLNDGNGKLHSRLAMIAIRHDPSGVSFQASTATEVKNGMAHLDKPESHGLIATLTTGVLEACRAGQ